MFQEDGIEVMHKMMAEHPFATVVSAATGGLSEDHIPLVLHGGPTKKGCLRGHIAAANPLWRDTEGEIQILAVFFRPTVICDGVLVPFKADRRQGGPNVELCCGARPWDASV